MTAPGHLDDEQLTALLDGEGTDDDRAHLGTCDACAERAEALRTVAALVGAPPSPPPSDARDEAVATALAAADRPVAVVPRPSRRRPPAWLLPAAAVVALVALVAVVVPRWDQGSDDGDSGGDAAARSFEEGGGAEDDAAERGSAPAPAADAPTLFRADLGELGSIDDEAALAARIDEALTTSTASHEDAAVDPGPCDGIVRQVEVGLGSLVLRASATWQGTPAEALAYAPAGAAAPTRAVVVAVDGCTTLADVDLP